MISCQGKSVNQGITNVYIEERESCNCTHAIPSIQTLTILKLDFFFQEENQLKLSLKISANVKSAF